MSLPRQGQRFNDPKVAAKALVAAYREGTPVAIMGLTRLEDVKAIAEAIAEETGLTVVALKHDDQLTHFVILDPAKEVQP